MKPERITLTEDQERDAGEALAKFLRLKRLTKRTARTEDDVGRYNLVGGTKTDLGLYRMLRRFFDEIEATGKVIDG